MESLEFHSTCSHITGWEYRNIQALASACTAERAGVVAVQVSPQMENTFHNTWWHDLTRWLFYLIDKCSVNLPFNRKQQLLFKWMPERDHNPHGVGYRNSVSAFFFFSVAACLSTWLCPAPTFQECELTRGLPCLCSSFKSRFHVCLPMTKL